MLVVLTMQGLTETLSLQLDQRTRNWETLGLLLDKPVEHYLVQHRVLVSPSPLLLDPILCIHLFQKMV